MSLTETHEFTSNPLIAESYPVITETRTLKSGENLTRGAVLGTVTADDKLILSASAAVDGSQTAECVLAADADATAGDTEVPVYVSGSFNATALNYGAGHDAASVAKDFRGAPLFLKTPL